MASSVDVYEFLESVRNQFKREKNVSRDLDIYLENKAREKGTPIHGQFELTPLCNFDCKMCYTHLNIDQLHEHRVLSTDVWKTLILQAWKAGMYKVTLTGGECLAYPGFKDIYLYLHSLGCQVSILTNGALLDEQWIEFFKNHMPALIQITLYGSNNKIYENVTGRREFDNVISNIKKINKAALPLSITVTPSCYLGESAFETVRLAMDLCRSVNINSGLFDPREETGRSGQKDDLDVDFYLRLFRYKMELDGKTVNSVPTQILPETGGPHHNCTECGLLCGGGRSGFVIDWKGILHPCNRLADVEANPIKDGFESAWRAINQIVNSWPRVPECDGCAYRAVCNTCAANMRQYADPGIQPIEYCQRTKYFVQHGIGHIPECD